MFKAPYSPILQVNEELAASKSAEITEQIAIEFAEWCSLNATMHPKKKNWYRYADKTDELLPYTTKELFQEFLKKQQ